MLNLPTTELALVSVDVSGVLQHWRFLLGALFVAVVLLSPKDGVWGAARRRSRRRRPFPGGATMTVLGPNESILDPREAALGTEGLVRRFGEVTAVDDVTLAVPSGELRAVIGPNGAGKTTLFNVVTGLLSPTAGRVWFEGTDVTDAPQYERPHAGLARSFQSNELFTEESVLENVRWSSRRPNTARSVSISFATPRASAANARSRSWTGSASTRPTTRWRRISRTATSVASASPWRWPPTPTSSCSTSRPAG
ncbi:ATP-binding cassette domain-containing protein [Haloplanus sp. GCM10025708]|uniref:ATP-binding cassette domain-containing protein n=1 Tax=Haloplanus sp. GCM10025708 TaxID=3252679 RepID=UPI00360DE153